VLEGIRYFSGFTYCFAPQYGQYSPSLWSGLPQEAQTRPSAGAAGITGGV